MYVMVPAVIRFYLADGTVYLSDEVRISLAGRRPPYGFTVQAVNVIDEHVAIPVGRSTEEKIGVNPPKSKLWVRRDVAWVSTTTTWPGRYKYLQLTKISDRVVTTVHGSPLGLWMMNDMVPRYPLCLSRIK